MATDRQLEDAISRWLEAEAPRQLPDRVLRTTFERTRGSRQQAGVRGFLERIHLNSFIALSAAAVVLVIAGGLIAAVAFNGQRGFISPGVAPSPTATPSAGATATATAGPAEQTVAPVTTPSPAEPTPTATPQPTQTPVSDFVGTWTATDPPPESSNLTMVIVSRTDGNFDITIHDDHAAVCSTVPSTMTGVAEPIEPGIIVIAQPEFVCDDGSDPHVLSGPPLAEQLRNLTFRYNTRKDRVIDSGGLVWSRASTGP